MNAKTNPMDKAQHLAIIGETISRMSTTSAIFKGFTATIVSGTAATMYYLKEPLIIVLLLLPILSFAILDIYYLQKERKYRYLYELVRMGKKDADYSMNIDFDTEDCKKAKATIWGCIKSPSIALFYPEIVAVLSSVLIMRIVGTV